MLTTAKIINYLFHMDNVKATKGCENLKNSPQDVL